MTTPIRTENLSKRFHHTAALEALGLDIPESAIFALIGPNGAGKTTTIKLIMNILSPTRGRSEILGVDSRRISPRELASIGYVSENQKLPGWMTLGCFLAYLKPFYPDWDDGAVAELLRQFDLPLDRKLSHFSRGMRMKAAMLAALAYHPRVLILDEPLSGLDPLVRDELIEGLLERAAGVTVLISSHDLDDIESFASHIGYLDRGRLRFSEDMTSLADRFREVEVTLDTPPSLPAGWPRDWIRPQSSPALLRFIDTRFDAGSTPARIRALFPAARGIEFHPMSLRSIFVALAKSAREAA